ncbi:hypothetical protein B9Z19DRAFT_1134191 [Tuber borchii]|uniref:Uncharacterized protein n=1 Tax=Tuber borchii TaxID=42251 RepID=A0A2T6ZEJ9_TUBBO|nr:hypothetical protein B9Z19DRAFT_1134191 [Tuber borchii]
MDSHPPTSQPSSQPSGTNPHSQSEVPTEPLPSSELREFNERMTRRSRFLSDFQRYDPVQNMQALANHVFDLSENVRRMGHESSEASRSGGVVAGLEKKVIGLNGKVNGLNGKVTGLERRFGAIGKKVIRLERRVIGLKRRFATIGKKVVGLERRIIKLERRFRTIGKEVEQLVERVDRNHRETQQDFTDVKEMLMTLMGGGGA